MTGTLYIAATPLGNLDDVSKRLLDMLRLADVVYAEDTRRSRILLTHLGVNKPMRSLHSHNEGHRTHEVLEHLSQGESVVLLTDAGTPAVSDPGAELVAAAHAANYKISPLAGPSALAAALSVAGFTGMHVDVLFLGFLPTRGSEQTLAWDKIAAHRGVVVLFEAPNRLAKTLAKLAERDPTRLACVCREMTKMYEEVRRAPATELAAWAADHEIRGEITLVIGPSLRVELPMDDVVIEKAIERCLAAGLSPRDTAAAVAAILEQPRRKVYARCLKHADSR